jgi:hypothetical protein
MAKRSRIKVAKESANNLRGLERFGAKERNGIH